MASKYPESFDPTIPEELIYSGTKELTEKILDNQGDLKGDNIWVSILFTDIALYSTIIEHMSPETAVQFLNEYFSAMHDVIDEHEGQILSLIHISEPTRPY